MEREILVYIFSILCIIILIFIVYLSTISTDIYGEWSTPSVYPCTGTKEDAVAYYEYTCKPNPVTGLGCVVNGTTTVLYKNMALARKCDASDVRNISYTWQLIADSVKACHSDNSTCCATSANNCYTESSYCCLAVGPAGGENQCTLAKLPGTIAPDEIFDPSQHNGYLCSTSGGGQSITARTTCLTNLC